MSVTPTPIFPQTISNAGVQILPADTTTLKTICTGGANGSIINDIFVSSTDTSARDLQLYVTISGTDYLLFTLSIPANSGFTNSVAAVAPFHSTLIPGMFKDLNGNPVLYLASGAVLKAKVLTTVTTAKAISLLCSGGDF